MIATKKTQGPCRAQVVLGVLLFAVMVPHAMAWSSECRQNGGAISCVPLLDNGWEYFYGAASSTCNDWTFFSRQGPDLGALFGQLVAELTAWMIKCNPPEALPYLAFPIPPEVCSPTPAYYVEPGYWGPPPVEVTFLDVRPCSCFATGNYTGGRLDYSGTFRRVHPYCPPNHGFESSSLGAGHCQQAFYCAPWPAQETKNLGEPGCALGVGNPINVATGNKYEREEDYVGSGAFPLSVIRHYNSNGPRRGLFGVSWRGDFERSILYDTSGSVPVAMAYRPDGKIYPFSQTGSTFVSDVDVPDRLTRDVDASGNTAGWRYTTAGDESEFYDPAGRLLHISQRSGLTLFMQYDLQNRPSAVVDSFGRSVSFVLDAANRIGSLTDPNGRTYGYRYNGDGMLSQVTYPDGAMRTFVYNEPTYTNGNDLPSALTGIIDENGNRFAIFRYDAAGLATSTSHVSAGGIEVDRYDVTYRVAHDTDGYAIATDPLGTSRRHDFQISFGGARATSISQPCSTCGGAAATTAYDASTGAMTRRTDFNGIVTTYQRADPYGRIDLETQRVEAAGRPEQRTVTTQWHPAFRLPISIVEPAPGGSKTTTLAYDGSGNLTQKSISAPRNDGRGGSTTHIWNRTYTALGRVLTTTDPGGSVTTYTYYADNDPDLGRRGNVATITNAAGHVNQVTTYDALGRPLVVVDSNGLLTTLTYDLRGHLTSRQVGTELTSYAYDRIGQLIKVTQPDTSYAQYTYDAAHRLTRISDGLGNKIVYTLDAMGNRTREDVYDNAGQLARTRSLTYDALNRLARDIGAQGQTTTYTYDGAGNRLTQTDPLTHRSVSGYDALNRLLQVTDPGNGVTRYAYDAAGNLTKVTDPRNLATDYTYDGLGNMIQRVSPDTGTTAQTFDLAGNIATRQDGRDVTATYSYDALNRVTQAAYAQSGAPTEIHAYEYDGGAAGVPNATGRLTKLTDPSSVTTWTYTPQGRVATKAQRVDALTLTLGYSYNGAGQRTGITTASGQVLGFTFVNNRISGITVNGSPLLSSAVAMPFGPVGAWQWSNGLYTFRDYDLDGRVSDWELRNGVSILRNDLTWDAANRITAISDPVNAAIGSAYRYDALDRLTVAQSGNPAGHTQQFNYDALGNRQNVTIDGAVANLAYAAGSNQLQQMTGNVSPAYLNGATTLTFNYNNANRLVAVQSGATPLASYAVNALGQRVRKTVGADTTYFFYDEQGRLLGEYDATGALIEETVWLEDLPVATLRPTGAGSPPPIAIYYVHADHLGSPRAITRPGDNAMMWRWDNVEPFGANAPDENPGGQGTFTYSLRFPGQYYDAETGMHYNYFRDYDPAVGRYEQSDPIGLFGGPDTYSYVRSNPLAYLDSRGLAAELCSRWFFPLPVPYARHCFVQYSGGGSSSFDDRGVHPDPAPSWWPHLCAAPKGDPNDACVKREMEKCKAEEYDLSANNCCHCAERALTSCGLTVPRNDWPNWPVNPGPPAGSQPLSRPRN